MATGIKITKAEYGVGTKTVDVKAAVSTHIKEGELNLVVSPDSLGIDDPAPGQTKQLMVSYTVNDGSPNMKTAYDNEAIIIAAPPERVASGLDIKKAQYGYPGNMTDVTDALRDHIRDGLIKLKVNPSSLGIPDPNPNKQKTLEVDYTLNGAKNSDSIKDNSMFSVSAPAAQSSGNDSNFGTEFGYAVLWAILYSLYFISIVSAYHYGKLFNPYVGYFFGGISLIPIGGFSLVCLFAMFYPFYSGAKLDIVGNVMIPFRSTPSIIAIPPT